MTALEEASRAAGPRQAAILEHLREHPDMTADGLSRVFGLRNDLKRTLRKLEDRAEVVSWLSFEPSQGRSVTRWRVAPPGTVPPPREPEDPVRAAARRERERIAQQRRRARLKGAPEQPTELPSLPGAACAAADPDLFFGPARETVGDRRRREAKAITVCIGCPVRASCYAGAAARREAHGVWGGVSFEPADLRGRKKATTR